MAQQPKGFCAHCTGLVINFANPTWNLRKGLGFRVLTSLACMFFSILACCRWTHESGASYMHQQFGTLTLCGGLLNSRGKGLLSCQSNVARRSPELPKLPAAPPIPQAYSPNKPYDNQTAPGKAQALNPKSQMNLSRGTPRCHCGRCWKVPSRAGLKGQSPGLGGLRFRL